jgi:Holliday junction DNA helicase RuvB
MLDKVVGQERAKQALELLSHGYKRRGIIPPIGIFGGSGLGKTHLVTEWAEEIGAKVVYINGTSIKDALAFRGFFREAREDARNYYIMFVDEAHGLPNKVQDNLLSVLEDPAILCTVAPREVGRTVCVDGVRFIEKGDVIREELPKNMSFVMATTDPAQLKEPVLNRLRKIQLTPYTMDHKVEIAMAHLVDHGFTAGETILEALANRSRSVRHLKTELCETYIDIRSLYGEDEDSTLVTMDDMLGIDPDGATDLDIDYLEYLVENNTVGLETMAGKLRIDKAELTKTIEPFLLEKGWIQITGKGRRLTSAGFTKAVGDDAVTSE